MASQFAVDLIFGLKGDGKIKQAADKLQGVDSAAQKLNGRLRDSKGRFIGAGNAASGAANGVRKFGNSTNFAARAAGKLNGSLGGLIRGLGATLAAGKIVRDFADLDTSLRRLGTVGGDVKSLDAGLGALSSKLGGLASKADLAKASYQALSAGFTDSASNLQVVEAATKASVGGLEDVAGVTEVLTKTLNAYNMSGSDAVKVTDSISKAIEFGQVQWSDYTSQLGRAVSLAAVAGVSLNEVNAFIAASTKNGATAEIAFTGLGAALNTLLQPTKESVEAAKELGIQWNLAGLRSKGFPGLMAELAVAMQTNEEAAVRLLGSQEALRGIFSANAKGGKDYKEILEGLSGAAGKTQSDFDKMKGSLANQLKALDTEFKNLAEASKPLIMGATKLLQLFGQLPGPVKTTALAIAALGAAALISAPAITSVVQGLIALKGVGIATALITAGPWVAAAAGVAALGKALYDTNETFRNFVDNVGDVVAGDFKNAVDGMATDAGNSAKVIETVYKDLQAEMAPISANIQKMFEGAFGKTSDAATASASQSESAFSSFFSNMVSEGSAAFAQLSGIISSWWANLPAPIRNLFGGGAIGDLVGAANYAGSVVSRTQDYGRTSRFRNARDEAFERARGIVPTSSPVPKPTVVPGGNGDGSTGSKGGKGDAERAAREAEATRQRIAGLGRELALERELTELKRQQFEAQFTDDQKEIARLAGEEKLLQLKYQRLEAEATIKDQKELAAKLAVIEEAGLQAQLETKYALLDVDKAAQELRDNAISDIQEENDLLQAKLAGKLEEYEIQKRIKALEKAGVSPGQASALVNANAQLKKQAEAQDKAKASAEALAGSISSALTDSLRGLIDGSMTAEEALSSAFKGIGDAFVDMAMQMIQEWIKMQIIGLVGNLFKGPAGPSSLAQGFDVPMAQMPAGMSFDGGGYTGNAPRAGGLDGKGGFPAILHPGETVTDHRGSAARKALNGGDGSGGGAPSMTLNVTATQIADDRWVKVDDLDTAMSKAARQGAAMGERRTLDRLRQSPKTRRQLGI